MRHSEPLKPININNNDSLQVQNEKWGLTINGEKILTEGIVFKGAKSPAPKKEEKVKTKAKKKTYITGLHNSGAAKMKAEIRRRRANRHKNG